MAIDSNLLNEYQSKDFDVYYQQSRFEMLKYVPLTVTRVLDVGCSSGDFGALVKAQRHAEVWGVELNPNAAAIASQKLDQVYCDAFSADLNLPKQQFDCIVFNDVLEHLIDPYSILRFTKTLLAPDGVIVASIPNVRYFGNIWKLLIHKDWKYTDQGILDRTHLRFFTQRSILDMFESLEYSVRCLEGIHPLDEKHPNHRMKFNLLNLLLFRQIEDMRYFQFAIVAHPIAP